MNVHFHYPLIVGNTRRNGRNGTPIIIVMITKQSEKKSYIVSIQKIRKHYKLYIFKRKLLGK